MKYTHSWRTPDGREHRGTGLGLYAIITIDLEPSKRVKLSRGADLASLRYQGGAFLLYLAKTYIWRAEITYFITTEK
jgi:hypothetical protein